jgi:hypothetical protein
MATSNRGTGRRGRRRAATAVVALAVAATLVAAACTAPGGGTGPTTSTTPPGDDAFTVVFIGDPEPRMRGNTDAEVSAYVRNLIAYRTTKVAHFAYEGGTHRIDPELVVLGGDISADRDTSVATDMPIWQQLYDNGIAFIAGFGNHDWEPKEWGDGPGYSLAGHLSNENTKAFTRETYLRSAQLTGDFTFREVQPSSTYGPVTFLSTYRGVDIANFNTFLYQPSYFYPEGWPLSCNVLLGGAGCETFASAEPQIEAMESLLSPFRSRTMLFMQHYPISTDPGWWDDHGASGTTVAQKQQRLLGLMDRYDHVALLTAHNHVASSATHTFGGRQFQEYVAPYFGGGNGEDPTQGGGFVALLVSPTRGILEVTTIPGGN